MKLMIRIIEMSFLFKRSNEGCSVRLGISSDGGTAYSKYVIESYETIKNLLC
ncbi:MAG: hypothetical protein ACLUOT_23240 [Bacteroides ovatus]